MIGLLEIALIPIFTSLCAAVTVYAWNRLSAWTYPVIFSIIAPLTFILNVAISGPIVRVSERAQNTQGFAVAGLMTIAIIISIATSIIIMGAPIFISVAVWAEKEMKKFVTVLGISFLSITVLFWAFSIPAIDHAIGNFFGQN